MSEPAGTDSQSDFDRFRSLAQRILTTPKADLVKTPAKKPAKPTKLKKKDRSADA